MANALLEVGMRVRLDEGVDGSDAASGSTVHVGAIHLGVGGEDGTG